MALTKKITRAEKVAAKSKTSPAGIVGTENTWKLPTPGAFGSGTPDLSPETKRWNSLGKQVRAGAKLRARTNSERYTGKRVQYTNPKSAKSGIKGAPIATTVNTPSGKHRKK